MSPISMSQEKQLPIYILCSICNFSTGFKSFSLLVLQYYETFESFSLEFKSSEHMDTLLGKPPYVFLGVDNSLRIHLNFCLLTGPAAVGVGNAVPSTDRLVVSWADTSTSSSASASASLQILDFLYIFLFPCFFVDFSKKKIRFLYFYQSY